MSLQIITIPFITHAGAAVIADATVMADAAVIADAADDAVDDAADAATLCADLFLRTRTVGAGEPKAVWTGTIKTAADADM